MAMPSNAPKRQGLAWKHIGLYGHSVGTFTADPAAIQWKSTASDDDTGHTTRLINGQKITAALWTVFGRSAHLRVASKTSSGDRYPIQELRFDGFPPGDYDKLRQALKNLYDVDLSKHTMSSCGASFGKTDISGRHLVFRQCIVDDEEGEDGDEMMSMDLAEVSQCVLPGNTRNEIELQFHESDTVEYGTDQLVQIRLYVPPDGDVDPSDPDQSTSAELFQQRIMTKANIKNTTGSVIAEFDENEGTFLTPRGRYKIELFDVFLRMRGNKYDYKIKYDDINRLFLLPKPDDVHMAFVIALDRPIRQGQQRYQYLVLQTTKEQSQVSISLDEETLQREYNGDLQPVMHGSLSNLVAKVFKVVTRKKVFVPGKFANSNQQACVKCALRANEGHLYPLEKQFIFIHKPSVLVRFDEIESVEFQRYAGGQGSTRNFDLCVTLRDSIGDSKNEYIFSGIDRSDYAALYSFLSGKKIIIKNIEDDPTQEPVREPLYNEDIIYGTSGKGEEESSEDEDYGPPGAESESEEISDGGSEDEGSDLGDASADDSDLEEARRNAMKEKKKQEKVNKLKEQGTEKEKTKKRPGDDSSHASSKASSKSEKKRKKEAELRSSTSNVESPPLKKKKESKEIKEKVSKIKDEDKGSAKKKKKKDPNEPKKNWSSYMFFTNDKRAEIKSKNPDASFGDIAKLMGAEFKKLTDEERKKYEDMADQDKLRYKSEMKNYTPPSGDEDDADKSEKGKKKKGPKKNLSSYNYYYKAVRDDVAKKNPGASFGGLSKIISGQFKLLSKDEKKKYESLAKDDKERYAKEMEKHGGDDKKGKKAKAVKDPNAPKKNLTSYMLFAKAVREETKRKNPDASFGELGKLMGEEFKKLSPEERKKWDDKAESEKQRYIRAMKEYEDGKKLAAAAAGTDTEPDSDKSGDDADSSGSDVSDSDSGTDDDTEDDSDDDSD
eukprot:CAMPEP_0172483482 /NCGR_PEP_ID=MMETSP1066-20121228/10494_1 /TAXON_ID=671091 /ORGANISM="Coscinodiscus wailesii, Strain CCMP2513" /LENGTH=946 /DNA_ID=CAMNT_0013247383 /DNA_START=94 /DNA_END=2934 /DNA_ORIENTATION=-